MAALKWVCTSLRLTSDYQVIINIMADSLHMKATIILVKVIKYHKKKMERLTKAIVQRLYTVEAAIPKSDPAF